MFAFEILPEFREGCNERMVARFEIEYPFVLDYICNLPFIHQQTPLPGSYDEFTCIDDFIPFMRIFIPKNSGIRIFPPDDF